VTVQVGLRPDEPTGPPGPTSTPTPATTSTSAPAAEPISDDGALIERASFGWLPDGLRPTGYNGDRQDPDVPFFMVTAQNAYPGSSVSLVAYEPGKAPGPRWPHQPGTPVPRRIPAEPVKGRGAHWVTKPNTSPEQPSFVLRWEYAPNGWAELGAHRLRGTTAELTRMAYRI
ncbi:hypothetical protein ACFQ07_04300, partial [Actinomadura adrarensis]